MALTILLADDSMTAQKMGKDILVSAGYEVIAVSNGAAAAKKLAEKPDIIILDVFMPGHTGLEICEKVRASMDISKTPVLLTVGKMEHFDPQDSARVKADGLIVKPFEATDLLATIKKLEQKIAATVAAETPSYEKTMILDRAQIQEFKDASYDEWKTDAAEMEVPPPPPLEMSNEMASAPAFADDMMGAPSPTSMDETVNFPPMAAPAVDFAPVEMPPPMMMDPVPSAPSVESEIEFTSAPRGNDAKIVVEDGLEADNIEVAAPTRDPALVTDPTTMATEFATKFGVDKEEEEAYVPGFDKPAEEIAPIPAPAADDDFEARVAAAMNSYETDAPAPVETAPVEVEAVEVPTKIDTQKIEAVVEDVQVEEVPAEPELAPSQLPPEGMQDAALVEQMQQAFADLPVASPAPAEEPVVQAVAAPDPMPAPAIIAPTTAGPDMELASALAAAVGGEPPQALAAPVAAAAAAGRPGLDPHTVAAVVSRVMEKMLPSIMTEVAKELDNAKK